MASSSDPEKGSNKSESKSDNPFIKFRQFADQQISSLLQGIVGLPSAFSGKPSESPRWAVFDEDLRRRDELQARQQELRESEARRLSRQRRGEDIPAGWAAGDWPAFARWLEKASTTDQDNDGLRDVPLYSPVTKSIFAHLRQPPDGEDANWNLRDDVFESRWRPNAWLLKPYERSSNALKTAQYMIYDDLNASIMLRSNYSLLPYMMFSPYSPFRLIENLANSPENWGRDTFPYVDAFEDLIRTTQPRQKPLILSKLFSNGLSIRYPDSEGVHQPDSALLLLDPVTRAHAYYSQIYHFHQNDLLQESEVLPLPQPGSLPFPVSTDVPHSPGTGRKPISKEAQTEQEMYEHFLRWASQPSEKFEGVVAEAKATFAKELESGKVPDIFNALSKMLESKSLTELFEELDPEHDLRKQKQAQLRAECEKSGEDPDKVVSESTSTSRVKQVDGSVRTYVHVWKMFADGRETTTSSSHVEEPERDEDGIPKPFVSMAEESKARSEKWKAEKEAEVKKASKKGWFWN